LKHWGSTIVFAGVAPALLEGGRYLFWEEVFKHVMATAFDLQNKGVRKINIPANPGPDGAGA
jgi:hypothetical protein